MKKLFLISTCAFLSVSCFKQEIIEKKNVETNKISDSVITSANEKINNNTKLHDSSYVIIDSAMEYSTAKTINTADGWRKFKEDNPDYINKKEIDDYIIRAEVNEIVNNKETGAMPESEKISGGDFKISTIEVENDTSCDLTLRYSGTDAKLVVIPPNSKSKVKVASGNYTVAATACGYNYAGKEKLSGNYSVVYYITTTRY